MVNVFVMVIRSTITDFIYSISTKGADKVILVTDSLMAKGFPLISRFMFGGHEIEIYEDGSAHRRLKF